jgi:hypothetical protein
MKKLILGTLNFATYGYIIFAIILWAFNQFGIDLLGMLQAMGLPPDFFGATGLVALTGKSAYHVVKTILVKMETRATKLYQENQTLILTFTGLLREVLQAVLKDKEVNHEISNKLSMILEFEKILATKNTQSSILSDEVKEQLQTWIDKLTVLSHETV